ncbi:MAG: DegT/DnrJ/EryC1/StrS family aminotransferase [Candidatus Omnitrophica bacterium]|nr:DegT/DnrJ/EryC1/StrS family aminotransferase [Candidatus Omnitrophota bacterium]
MGRIIPLFKPSMDNKEVRAVRDALFSGWIGLGPKTQEFEEKFADYIGVKYAVGVNSGTAALHLALKVLDLRPQDEVITTALTFVSTNHAIIYNNARPVFADIEQDTLTLDIGDIKRKLTPRTKVILPVHYGGHPADLDEIIDIVKDRKIYLVEDAAHACGAQYKGRRIGTFGDLTCFSFHAVKNLSVGEGGMITTNNKKFAERLQRLRWMGINRTTWDRAKGKKKYSWQYTVDEIGFKEHLDDIHSAIGLVQLSKLEKLNQRRRQIISIYNNAFNKIEWITLTREKPYVKSAYHLYVIRVPYEFRDRLINYLAAKGISAGVHYFPNHFYCIYEPYRTYLPVTEEVYRKIITLPLYPDLKNSEINRVINAVYSFANLMHKL